MLFDYCFTESYLLSFLWDTPSAPPTPTEVTALVTNVSTVRVTWQWTSSDPATYCFNTTSVIYCPEGGGELSLQLSDPAATEATLTDLQCNTNYTVTVVATAGEHRREGVAGFPLILEGTVVLLDVYMTWGVKLETHIITAGGTFWVADCITGSIFCWISVLQMNAKNASKIPLVMSFELLFQFCSYLN